MKKDIKTIVDALGKVNSMRGVTFIRTIDELPSVGVIAQEIQEVLPEVVMVSTDGMLSVSYGNIVGVLIESIKELNAKVENLQEKLRAAGIEGI